MRCSGRLRAYHDKRLRMTEALLLAALHRLNTGNTSVVVPVEWTKAAWAREAGVNINTVVSKRADGQFVFSDSNHLFELLRQERCRKAKLEQLAKQEREHMLKMLVELQRKDGGSTNISL